MKKLILSVLVVVLIISVALATTRININGAINEGGCVWKVKGWIDVSFFPPSLNHYDVYATDCHGTVHHFSGRAINPNNSNGNNNLSDFEILSGTSYPNIAGDGYLSNQELLDYILQNGLINQ